MSSTNKTTNYELSQFLGSDKPAWLSDYNSDMGKIDTQMKANADAATAASGSASTNATNIGVLANLTTDAKTSLVAAINEVDGHADSAASVANSASTTANAASTKANALEAALNLDTINQYSSFTVTGDGVAASIEGGTVTIAKNSDGSLAKIYGNINIESSATSGDCYIRITSDSGLRPSTDLTITGTNISFAQDVTVPRWGDLIVKTTGEVLYKFNKYSNKYTSNKIFACLIFVKDFGDQPQL